MAYNPGIPQATQLISVTQSQIQTNFNQINEIYGSNNPAADPDSDHYSLLEPAPNARKHRKVRLPILAPGVLPTPAVNSGVIYTKTVGAQSLPYYRKDNSIQDFSLLPIRAMGRFTNAPIPVAVGTWMNITTVTRAVGPVYTITMPAGTIPAGDRNYIVLISTTNPTVTGSPYFADISDTQFTVAFTGGIDPANVAVVVLHYL